MGILGLIRDVTYEMESKYRWTKVNHSEGKRVARDPFVGSCQHGEG